MKNEHECIKTILWELSIEDTKSNLPGYIHIKAPSSKYTEDIKKQLKILEYNPDFHKEVEAFRKSRGFPKIELLELEMREKSRILQRVHSIPPSKGLHEYSVSLCKRYLKNQLPLSFATYIIFNFFPIEPTLSKVSLLVRIEPNPDNILIQIDRNMGITELKNELDKLLKEEIEKYLKTFQSDPDFERDNDTFDLMVEIYDMHHLEKMPYEQIANKLCLERGMVIDADEAKRKAYKFHKRIKKSIADAKLEPET